MWMCLWLLFAQDGRLEFMEPADDVFAGMTSISLKTDLPADDIVGIELFVGDRSVWYFDKAPFDIEIDMSRHKQGPITLRAVLELFSGEKYTAEVSGRNHANFVEEKVHLVRIPLLIDGQGGGILPADRFQVFENGKPQKLELLVSENQPLQLTVLLDLSGSMEGREALLRRGLKALTDLMRPGDRVQVIGFNETVFEIAAPSTDMEEVLRGLRILKTEGSTNLYGAVWSGLKSLGKSNRKRALVMFTDGEHDLNDLPDLYNKTLQDCVGLARDSGIPIYGIGFGNAINPKTLEELSFESGGKPFFLKSRKKARDAFAAIGSELRRQYLLCYYSKSEKTGGHTIEVRVEGGENLHLRYPKRVVFK